MRRIRLPVRRHAQHGAGTQPARNERHELRLHDASLVMALLRPGIREVQQHLIERVRRQALLQHFDCVAADRAHVRQPQFLDAQHEVADTGTVHLEPQVVALGVCSGQGDQGLAVAEADLQRARCLAPEDRSEVERGGAGLDAVARPQFSPCPLLGGGHAPGAHDETADRASPRVGSPAWEIGVRVVWRHAARGARVER